MKKGISNKVKQIIESYKKKKRWQKLLYVLYLVVIFATVHSLIIPAITIDKDGVGDVQYELNDEGVKVVAQNDESKGSEDGQVSIGTQTDKTLLTQMKNKPATEQLDPAALEELEKLSKQAANNSKEEQEQEVKQPDSKDTDEQPEQQDEKQDEKKDSDDKQVAKTEQQDAVVKDDKADDGTKSDIENKQEKTKDTQQEEQQLNSDTAQEGEKLQKAEEEGNSKNDKVVEGDKKGESEDKLISKKDGVKTEETVDNKGKNQSKDNQQSKQDKQQNIEEKSGQEKTKQDTTVKEEVPSTSEVDKNNVASPNDKDDATVAEDDKKTNPDEKDTAKEDVLNEKQKEQTAKEKQKQEQLTQEQKVAMQKKAELDKKEVIPFYDGELTGEPLQDLLTITASHIERAKEDFDFESEQFAWLGDDIDNFSTAYLSLCLEYANADTFPKNVNTENMIDELKQRGYWNEKNKYGVREGDVVFVQEEQLNSYVVNKVSKDNLNNVTGISVIKLVDDKLANYDYEILDENIVGFANLQGEKRVRLTTIIPKIEKKKEDKPKVAMYKTFAGFAGYEDLTNEITDSSITGAFDDGVEAYMYPLDEHDDNDGEFICGYDIVLKLNGQPYNVPDGIEVNVSITIPNFTTYDNYEYAWYHIKDSGEKEKVETSSFENGKLSFVTTHFSKYEAREKQKSVASLDKVYLNPKHGDDNDDGDGPENAVRTLEKALELLNDGGEIEILSTMLIDDTTTIDAKAIGKKFTLVRGDNFKEHLIEVKDGNSLTLKGFTITGANKMAYAPLIKVGKGAALEVSGGMILENNDNRGPNYTKAAPYGMKGEGGAIHTKGNVWLTNSTIRNCASQIGGAIYAVGSGNDKKAAVILDGSTIKNNKAKYYELSSGYTGLEIPNDSVMAGLYNDLAGQYSGDSNYSICAGGGVYLGDYSYMTMDSGVFQNNKAAREGGAISLAHTGYRAGVDLVGPTWSKKITSLEINGGQFINNYANSFGGAINISGGRYAYINRGEFTGNSTYGIDFLRGQNAETHSGGAIFIEEKQEVSGEYKGDKGMLSLQPTKMTGNKSRQGGAIAGCYYSEIGIYEGASFIYGNKVRNSSNNEIKNDIHINNQYNSEHWQSGNPPTSNYNNWHYDIASNMIDGVTNYNWKFATENTALSDADFQINGNPPADAKYKKDLVIHTDYNGTQVNESAVRVVFRNNNSRKGRGGAVAVNGTLKMISDFTSKEYVIIKRWVGDNPSDRPSSVRVKIKKNGEVIDGCTIVLNEANNWTEKVCITQRESDVITLEEVQVTGYTSTVQFDDSIRRIGYDCQYLLVDSGTNEEVKWVPFNKQDGESVYWKVNRSGKFMQVQNVTTGNKLVLRQDANDGIIVDVGTENVISDKLKYESNYGKMSYKGTNGRYRYFTTFNSPTSDVGYVATVAGNENPETRFGMCSANAFIITNTKGDNPQVNTVLRKIDGGTGESAGESKFKLYVESAGGNYSIAGKRWQLDASNGDIITSSVDGLANIQNLLIDTVYLLVEEQAPDGYSILKKPIVFKLDRDGNVIPLAVADYPESDFIHVKQNSGSQQEDEVAYIGMFNGQKYLHVKNTKDSGYSLPETGGIGTTMYNLLGVVIMLLALGGILYKRKRGKENV